MRSQLASLAGRAGFAATVTVAILISPLVAAAADSLSSPHRWWDLDDDGIRNEPAEGDRAFNIKGAGWNQARLDRAADATAEWRGDTSWDVTAELPNVVTPASIYVDRNPPCGPGDFSMGPALACITRTQRTVGNPPHTWLDISDADIYMHPNETWHTGAAQGPGNVHDFQGVLTHELGHGGGLVHSSSCADPWSTMCTPAQGAPMNGFWARTLIAQDINDMNSQY